MHMSAPLFLINYRCYTCGPSLYILVNGVNKMSFDFT